MSRTSPASVYIIADQSGMRKIGVSDQPERRMVTLRSTRKCPLTLVASYDRPLDARLVERAAHTLLVSKRVNGEWFDVTEDQAIDAIRQAIDLVEAGERAPGLPRAARGEGPG